MKTIENIYIALFVIYKDSVFSDNISVTNLTQTRYISI